MARRGGPCGWLRAAALLVCAAAPARARADEPAIALHYVADLLGNVSGGLRRDSRWIGRLDLWIASPPDLFGVPGARAALDLMALHGGGFSQRIVGDAQVASNVDAPHAVRPYEAWIEAPIADRVRAKAGYVDLNSEFDVQPVGDSLLNSSFGIAPDFSQSGRNGPSIFPVTAPGVVLAVEQPRWALKAALFDGVAGDPARPHRAFARPFRAGALFVVEGQRRLGRGELQVGG